MDDIECGVELTGGVRSSDQWGGVDVVVRRFAGLGGEIDGGGGHTP
jgi:hypothetical protein